MAKSPLYMTWFATGNNVMIAADTARRVCHIRLESPCERPEERGGFRQPDLLAWIGENRAELLRHDLDGPEAPMAFSEMRAEEADVRAALSRLIDRDPGGVTAVHGWNGGDRKGVRPSQDSGQDSGCVIEGRHGSLGRMTNAKDLAARIKALDWSGVTSELETAGAAT